MIIVQQLSILHDFAKALIDAGSNINRADNNGMTALMYAASHNSDIAITLISTGAEVTKVEKDGSNALLYAAKRYRLYVAALLIMILACRDVPLYKEFIFHRLFNMRIIKNANRVTPYGNRNFNYL